MAGKYFLEVYVNPKNFQEKIEVKNYGNDGTLMYRQYVACSLFEGLKQYKGSEKWRKITRKSLIEITTTFEGKRWLQLR